MVYYSDAIKKTIKQEKIKKHISGGNVKELLTAASSLHALAKSKGDYATEVLGCEEGSRLNS